MSELMLIVKLAGERVAVRASQVESVVELESITPAPRTAPHVAGLSALRSRVLTVIDARASLGVAAAEPHPLREAIVMEADGHPYALAMDGVEDVVEVSGAVRPLRSRLAGGWRRVGLGMVEVDDELLLLVDPEALLAAPAQEAAARA